MAKVYDNATDMITFARSSSGTALRRVGYGENLVTNGDFDTDTVWTKGSTSGASISGGTLTANCSDLTNNRFVYQSFSTTVGKVYQLQYTVVTGNSSSVVRLGNGIGSNTMFQRTDNPIATYTETVVADSTTAYLSISGGLGSDLEVDNISVKEVIFDRATDDLVLFDHPDDIPRIEYAADGSLKGLLIEEQRTNLVANSQLGGAVVGVVGSGGALPTGWASVAFNTVEVMEIDTFQGVPRIRIKATCDNSGNGGPIYPRIEVGSYSPSASTTYNYSAWVMDGPDRSSIEADLLVPDGVGNFLNVDCSGATEMTQFSGSATTAAGATGTHTIRVAHTVLAGDVGVSDFYISMPQLEQGSFPTSYIPTSGGQKTRDPDIASIPVSAFGYNQDAGTWLMEWDTADTGNVQAKYVLSSGGNARVMYNNAGSTTFYSYDGSTPLPTYTNPTAITFDGSHIKAAYAEDDGGSSVAHTGVLGTGSGASDLLPNYNPTYGWSIGNLNNAAYLLNGHIKSLSYFPRRLTDAQLQELTA